MIKIPLHAISRLRPGTDGKGVRTLVVVRGCTLRCQYCLNPLSWAEGRVPKRMSPEELYRTVKIDDIYFRATNGGITFGGGEPALYADFIVDFVNKYCNRWHVDMQTALNVPYRNIERLIPVIDHFWIDIKSWNPETYEKYTGLDNRQVVANMNILKERCPGKVTVKIPLIPGFNDEDEQLKTARIMETFGFKVKMFQYTLDVNDIGGKQL